MLLRKQLTIGTLCFMVVSSTYSTYSTYSTHSIQAQAAPYVLTQTVNNIPVERNVCTELIRDVELNDEESETLGAKQNQVASISQEYEKLNQAIQQLEHEIEQLQQQVATRIDQIYQKLLNEQEQFKQLSEEVQVEQVQLQPEVQAISEQLQTQQDELAYQVKERDKLEQQYQTLNYEIEQQKERIEKQSQQKEQLNQCLLYPYSVGHQVVDLTVLNNQLALNDYIAKIDQILQKIVPVAYRKVHYDEIALLFSTKGRDWDQLSQALAGKQPIELAQEGEYYYGYARELNLYDIEILANIALKNYMEHSQNDAELSAAYQQVLAIRQAQFEYFIGLNPTQFDNLKQALAGYLNQLPYDSKIQQAIDRLHLRYQMVLVQYNEAAQQWQPLANDDNGYHDMYFQYDLFQAESKSASELSESSQEEELTEETTTPKQIPKAKPNTKTTPTSHHKLEELKNKLTQPTSKKAKQKILAKTPDSNTKQSKPQNTTKANNSPKESTKAKADSAKLPTTGEQKMALWISVGLISLAALLIAWRLYLHAKQKAKLKKIKLD